MIGGWPTLYSFYTIFYNWLLSLFQNNRDEPKNYFTMKQAFEIFPTESTSPRFCISALVVVLSSFLDFGSIRYNLTGDALALHDTYEDWLDLRISFLSQSKDIYNLAPAEVLLVQAIADNGTGIAAAQTQGLLNHLYGYHYEITPMGQGPQLIMAPNGNSDDGEEGLFAFPNPAKEEVSFRYKLKKGVEESLLTIHDLNGRLIAGLKLQGSEGTHRWETKGLASGIYYYKAEHTVGMSIPKKLVLIK